MQFVLEGNVYRTLARILGIIAADVSYAVLATTSLVNLGDPEWTAHGGT